MNNIVASGYSKKYKNYHQSNVYADEKLNINLQHRTKLVPLSPDNFKSRNTQKVTNFPLNPPSLPKCKLISILDKYSKDYEQAIQKHLGLGTFSRESQIENDSPLIKISIKSPTRFTNVSDITQDNSLESIELKELPHGTDIRGLKIKTKQLKKKMRNFSEMPRFDMEDSKLTKLKNTIKDMKSMIIKQKSK
ncbi:hypothetical protein SteCoe_30364 [Stentor coeruleus]|uniref:Uncharacterized protein n=1 Tax=Stentor coeruleus TaxID=5963 RepID=A0A1R2B494_9CILI|nr:hypothetical protein SteCoe_30364 [Stentor coeruleus]